MGSLCHHVKREASRFIPSILMGSRSTRSARTGLSAELGSIESGKRADFILLDGAATFIWSTTPG